MFRIIGIVTVVYLAFATGLAQAAMLITAHTLTAIAGI